MPDNPGADRQSGSSDPDPTPVNPPPASVAPSATGVVDGEEQELREAPPASDAGER